MPTKTPRSQGNLPADVTSFVGRHREVVEVTRLLSVSRLVTLIGPGGVGKTRLALRVAGDLRRTFSDGAWFAELGDSRDANLLAYNVARGLGLRQPPSRWMLPALIDEVGSRQLLLVLDNCEHLIDACAVVADTLLRTCPEMRILATSRQPIGVFGEHTLAVPTLSVPEADTPVTADTVAEFEAVTLFAERAAAARPGFAIDTTNCAAIARMCRQLEGLPLAIELAAVRVRALSVEEIADRLDQRFGLLVTGRRGVPERQQTLRSLIDWSLDLCTDQERLLWARSSVFADGFEINAAEAVCSDAQLPAEDVLDAVAGLVAKSVLTCEGESPARYRMLETIREYGLERLAEAGEEAVVRRRHRDWYQGLVARAEAEWFGHDQVSWMTRLRHELGNLRIAMDFCFSEPDGVEAGLTIASGLESFWSARTPGEGQHWLDRGLAEAPGETRARVHALRTAGWLALIQGERATATARLDQAHGMAARLGDDGALAAITQVRGLAALFADELTAAARWFEQALTGFRAAGVRRGETAALIALGATLALQGDIASAVPALEHGLMLSETSGEAWWRSYGLWALGFVSLQRGELHRAAELGKESLRLDRALWDRLGIAWRLELLAWLAALEHRHGRAAILLGAAERTMRVMGTVPGVWKRMSALHEECAAGARRALGSQAFDEAFRRGAELARETVVAYALDETTAPESPTAHPASYDPLTAREREIAELLTQGLTNREIGARLGIARRTAEGHVERILVKLGLTSRIQVMGWWAEHADEGKPG